MDDGPLTASIRLSPTSNDHRQTTTRMSHDAAPHAADTHAHDAGHGSHPQINYFGIFIALCVCTALSVVFDALPATKPVIAVLVLAVAVAKRSS